MSSRHHILDQVELIGNQIALWSHLQELIFSIENDIKYKDGDTEQEKMKIIQLKSLLKWSTDDRRFAMRNLWEWDKNYWCALKHAIAMYQFSTEVYQATEAEGDLEIQKSSYSKMIMILSLYLWLDEVVLCGRCLSDKLK
jgi:hypothetical protein